MRYERCYSAGADYLRNQRGILVTERPDQTTSVYQARYRETLRARGQWTPLSRPAEAPPADVVVRPVPDDRNLPANGEVLFRDRRFTAYRITLR